MDDCLSRLLAFCTTIWYISSRRDRFLNTKKYAWLTSVSWPKM